MLAVPEKVIKIALKLVANIETQTSVQFNHLKEHGTTKKVTQRQIFCCTDGSGAGQGPIKDDKIVVNLELQVACQTSINAVEDFSDVIQDKMGVFKMHRTKCTAAIKSVLAPHFREERQILMSLLILTTLMNIY